MAVVRAHVRISVVKNAPQGRTARPELEWRM
jgi:hypothetical protein